MQRWNFTRRHAFWILLPGRHLTKPLVFTYHIPIAVYFYGLLRIWLLTLKLLCSKTPSVVNVGLIHTSQNRSANLLVGEVAGFCLGRKIPNHKPLHHHFHYLDSTTLPLSSDTFSTTWRAPSNPLHPMAMWQSCFPGSNSSTFTCLRGRSEGRGEEGKGSRRGKKKKKSHVLRNVRLCCGWAVGSALPAAWNPWRRRRRTEQVSGLFLFARTRAGKQRQQPLRGETSYLVGLQHVQFCGMRELQAWGVAKK